jgi:hypothetical protein
MKALPKTTKTLKEPKIKILFFKMYRTFLFHLRFLVGAMLPSHPELFLKSVYRDEVSIVVTLAELMDHV